jgi:hypothetical protein
MNQLDLSESVVGAQRAAPELGRASAIRSSMVSGSLFLLFMAVTPSLLGDCKCHRPDKGEATHWGGNQVVIFVEEKSYRQLRGTIEMFDGRPIENALVEVFDHPDYLLDRSSYNFRERPEQKRLAVCRAAADGRFCFRGLPSGKYELRSSLGSGWNVTHVHVVVDRKAGQKKEIPIQMSLGT